ncbi:secreted RxLR effector protein 78-like [Silene latifolia]|uniref:secreted RxLR effector protein 78-like n=1 Tax=Silene latifolia TaxID=37657 RepID=UPI003D76DA2A
MWFTKLSLKYLLIGLNCFWERFSENQIAFTPGRLITDNILIAFEMFHYMKNSRHTEGHMAIKLDMAKAYDRVDWSFLRRVLDTMGFDHDWVNRVMECVSTVTFSVLINGAPSDEFLPERGLRQGDPLSPYLFILCAEALSNLMRRAVVGESLHGIRGTLVP